MHIQQTIVPDCDLMHVYEAREAVFACVFVVNNFDNAACFRGVAQQGFMFRLGLHGRTKPNGRY
jgi:hypothetical protein